MNFAFLGPVLLPLIAAWVLSSRAGASRGGRAVVASADALALISTALLWNAGLPRTGALDSDPFSLFLASSVLAAVAFAVATPRQDIEGLCRLHLGASLSIAAVSSRSVLVSVPAILLAGVMVGRGKERFVRLLAPGLVALGGLALAVALRERGLGYILLCAGLAALWLVVSREALRSSPSARVTGIGASFALLVALSSVYLRLTAWFPAIVPVGAIHALALGALALGALGVLGATRIATFLTALAVARAGLVWLAFLGGVRGRGPLLLELAASGVSLLLVAAALEKLDTLDDIATLASVPRRMVLTLGALSACSFPPFPGFVAAFPLSSAVLEEGHPAALLIACVFLFLLGLGSMRLVARAWSSGETRSLDSGIGIVPLILAIVAAWLLGVFPGGVVEAATTAARSVF